MSLENKIRAGFGLALGLLLLVGVASWISNARYQAALDSVARTDEVLDRLNGVLVGLLNEETAGRGYLISGEERFLEPLQLGNKQVQPALQALRSLTADNPGQQARLDALEPAAAGKEAHVLGLVESRRSAGFAAAAKLLAQGEGKQLMDAARKVIEEMKAEESRLLRARTESAQTLGRLTLGMVVGGLLLAVCSVAVAGLMVRNEFRQRQQAVEQLCRARDELELRVRERTAELVAINRALQQEMTVREQAEAGLRAGEQRLNFALQKCRTGGWDLDLVDHTAYRSLEHDRIFGYESLLPQWTYELFLEHVLPEDRAGVDRCFREAMVAQSDWSFECRILRRDREVRWIWAAGEHQRDEAGQARRMAGIIQDITERKRVEEELRAMSATLEQRVVERTTQLEVANKELEAFSYSVSHDLRAPLRGVDSFSRMVLEDYGPRLDDEGRRMLNVVCAEAKRMGQLIDDLLAFSRLGRQEMRAADCDLTALARSVFASLEAADRERVKQFELKPLPAAPGDRAMLQQVWANLIANAVKYSRHVESPAIEIGSSTQDGFHTYYVRDNGAGFDPRYTHKLFGVFQRLHTAEEFEGTGVGLALVQRIVHRHGGKVWAEGKLNAGATFYFTLPTRKET